MFELPREVPEMEVFDIDRLTNVSQMAGNGMNKAEILATFSVNEDDLDKTESIYFEEFYAYGRGMAVNEILNNLKAQTRGKNGYQPAMAFLRRFSKEFESDVQGDSSGEFNFTFGANS